MKTIQSEECTDINQTITNFGKVKDSRISAVNECKITSNPSINTQEEALNMVVRPKSQAI